MGYAEANQIGTGLRQRLYARVFIVGQSSNSSERFVYVVQDVQSGDTAVRYGVLQGLKNMGEEFAMYNENNVAITATHSHSGPGGWSNYY
jgi:neutral ceramidase